MIRPALVALTAHLASAGCAFSAPVFSSRPALPAAAEHLEIDTPSGTVPTLVVRKRGDAGAAPALLLGLHGYGMDESQIATLVDVEPDFDHVYLAPRGFHELADGSRAWFPIEAADGTVSVDPGDWRAFVTRFADFVEAAAECSGADPDRVYVIGYSQGGAAAISLAAARPDLAAAYLGFAGALLDAAGFFAAERHELAASQLFIGHGTLDAFVSSNEMRAQVDRLRALGLELTYREYPVPHVVSAAQRRDAEAWLERVHASRSP